MNRFTVTWTITVEADDPLEAKDIAEYHFGQAADTGALEAYGVTAKVDPPGGFLDVLRAHTS